MTETASIPKAALWMAGWLFLMLVTALAGRETTRDLNVFQVMEMRSVIGFFMLLPLVHLAGGWAAMRTARPAAHIGRNAAHYFGQLSWLYALTLIPLAEVVSIEFTTPFWTAILAVLYLGERLSRAKIAALVLGIIGVAVIVRPGTSAAEPGHLVMLAGAVGFAVSIVLVKALTRTESVVRIIFWMVIIQSVIGLIPALWVWRTPPASVWPWIMLIAFSGTFSHFCMARALAYADAMVVVPMDFLRVPLTALLGYLVYCEQIDMFTAIGAALILLGNLFNISRRKATVADLPSS
ncbi:EamA family transporter [Mesorhizobium sp. NBSH29]|uniref:DMT family transporter n=1 Tax=Mesorhizobium sp. NBSH29 TaxID=2654249 RepID=UPI0018966865|nr:DMT family transporter [Mesorhizobium sp. NBSH29]QPC87611.1 EamA family transporter [Mesorhizobium sp. NBSH29]